MTEEATTQVQAEETTETTKTVEEEAKAVFKSEPVGVRTGYGEVVIFGGHLVSEKTLNAIGACLNLPVFEELPHGVHSIFLKDEEILDKDGKPAFGLFYKDLKTIVISMKRIAEKSIEQVVEENPKAEVSFVAWIHFNTFNHILHEICHAMEVQAGIEMKDKKQVKDAEDRAKDFGEEMVVELVKRVDCEPVITEEPAVRAVIEEWFKDHDSDDELVKGHLELLKSGLMAKANWKDDDGGEHDDVMVTFKDFVRHITGNLDKKHDEWNAPTPMVTYVTGKAEQVQAAMTGDQGFAVAGESPFEGDDEPPWDENDFTDQTVTPEEASFSTPANSPEPEGGIDITQMFPQTAAPAAPQSQGFGAPAPAPAQPQGQAFGNPAPAQGQAFGAPETQPAAPAQAAPQPSMPQNGIDPLKAKELFIKLAGRIDQVIFGFCGYDGRGGFANPKAVTQNHIDLAAIDPMMPQFVIAADSEVNGQFTKGRPTDGGALYGNFKQRANLPGYTVHLNVNGQLVKRAFIPQNPNTGSNWAQEALAGHRLLNIIDDAKPQGDRSRWTAQVKDGVYTELNKG